MIGLVAGDDGGWSCSEGGRARVASDGRAADSRAKPANSNRLRRVRARALRAGSWLLWLGTILWFSWRADGAPKKRVRSGKQTAELHSPPQLVSPPFP